MGSCIYIALSVVDRAWVVVDRARSLVDRGWIVVNIA